MTFDPFTCDPQIDDAYNPTEEDWQSGYDEWDMSQYEDDQALEAYSLECAFGPEE